MRRSLALIALMFGPAACSQCGQDTKPNLDASAASSDAENDVASVATASEATTPAPSAPPSATAPRPAPVSVYDTDYEGLVGEKKIVVQLGQSGVGLVGRYFYADKGAFLELSGRADGDSISLVEKLGAATTGKWSLTKTDADSYAGKWQSPSGNRQLDVSLRAIRRKAGEPVMLFAKKIFEKKKATEPPDKGWHDQSTTCEVDIPYYQALGLSDRKLQSKLDARLLPPREFDCTHPGQHFGATQVYLNERGVLSLDYGWGFVQAGYARGDGGERGYVNAAIDRGVEHVETKRILKVAELEKVRKQIEASVDRAIGKQQDLPDHVRTSLIDSLMTNPEIRLGKTGIVFCGRAGFPQAFDALDGCDYEVSYAEMGPVLVGDSPVAHLWSGSAGP